MPRTGAIGARASRPLEWAAAAAILVLPLAAVVLRCGFSAAVPWVVPSRTPWLMAPVPVSADLQQWGEVSVPVTRFEARFAPDTVEAGAALSVRSLGEAQVWIDGVAVAEFLPPVGRGHAAGTVTLAPVSGGRPLSLRVDVRNPHGPGLLALESSGVTPPAGTAGDPGRWLVRVDETAELPAVPADDTRPNPRALAVETPGEAVARTWDTLLGLFFAGALAFWLLHRRPGGGSGAGAALAVPLVATAAWLGPLAIRVLGMPPQLGFDARHHLAYVQHLGATGALPAPAEGWSTYHPPLFYALAAGVEGLGLGNAGLKALPLLAGLATVWIAWWLARRLFPDAPWRAGLAALFAAVLPVNLYSAAYFSNEPLHAALAGGGLAAVVALLLAGRTGWIGVVLAAGLLAAAALTKFTVLVTLPVVFCFLGWKLLRIEGAGPRRAFGVLAGFAGVFLLVAGWFYLRTWLLTGTPVLGNWNLPGADQRWWQQPGFHTPAYFLGFGESLVRPYLSGFHSFADAFYSTFWGDGFIGGVTDPWHRHPFWNYAFMSAGYWLAVPATLLLLLGIGVLVGEALGTGDPRRRLALGFLATVGWAALLAFVTLTYQLAFFAQAKAPYLLFLTAPLALAFAAGYSAVDAWLAARTAHGARAVLCGWLVAFAGTLFLGIAG
ncbi:MAG: hypothetical protein VX546_08345 [Myxococcota bacterium]|nr:hypothetical protein [Myxococcota bacterium]